MDLLLFLSLLFSGLMVLVLVGVVAHLTHTVLRKRGRPLYWAAMFLAFSVWAYIFHIFIDDWFWKTRLFALIPLFDNLAAVFLLTALFQLLGVWEERDRWFWLAAGVVVALVSLPPVFMPAEAFRRRILETLGPYFVVDPSTPLVLTPLRVGVVWGLQLLGLGWLFLRMRRAGLFHRQSLPLLGLVVLMLATFNGTWLLGVLLTPQWDLDLILSLVLLWVPVSLGLWALAIEGLGLVPPRFFYALIQNTASGLLVYSWPQGRLLWWNERIGQWFPRGEGQAPGQDGAAPALPEALKAHLQPLLAQDGTATFYLDTPQPRYLSAESFSLPSPEQPVAKAVLLEDITEEEQARRHIQRHIWLTELRHGLLQASLGTASLREFAQAVVRLLVDSAHEAFAPKAAALYWPSPLPEEGDAAPPLERVAAQPEDLEWHPSPDFSKEAPSEWLSPEGVVRAPADWKLGLLPLRWQQNPPGYLVLAFEASNLPDPGLWGDFRREVASILAFLLILAQERDLQTWMVRAFYALPIPLVIAQVNGAALWANPAFWSWFPGEAEREQPLLDQVFGRPVWDAVRQALEEGEQAHWEDRVTLQRKDGETRTFLVHASPILSPQGRLESVSIAFYDITEQEDLRHRMERQRWFLERLMQAAVRLWQHLVSLHSLLEETIALIHEWYPDSRVTLVLFDRDAHGQTYVTTRMDDSGNIVPPGPFYYRALQESAAGWALRHQESLLIPDVTQDERWTGREMPEYPEVASAILVPIFYRRQAMGMLLVGHPQPAAFETWDRDLLDSLAQWLALALHNARLYDEQRRIQRLYHDEKTRLEALQRHLQNMLTQMAQQIRTPVRLMESTLDLMARDLAREETLGRLQERLRRYLREIDGLAELFLDVERVQRHAQAQPTSFQVKPLLEEIRDIVQPLLERYQVRLVMEVHPQDLTMEQDRRRLLRLLLTLVEFSVRRAQEGEVHVRAFYDPESPVPGVVFWVLDTGPTLPPEEAASLFEPPQEWGPIRNIPFAYRSEQLQLFPVREYVEHLQGKIQIREMLGYGLAFWLWIPQRLPSSP